MVYLHETIDVRPEHVDEFGPKLAELYRPAMESAGARLFAVWETTPFTNPWPQFIVLWELDDVNAVSALFRAQYTEQRSAFGAWRREFSRLATHSRGRMLTPSAKTLTLEAVRRQKVSMASCLHEWITTVQNMAAQYCKQLETIYTPVCHIYNRLMIGTYHNVWNNKEAINIWALPDEFTVWPSSQEMAAHGPDAGTETESWVVLSAGSVRESFHSGLMRQVVL